jgi:hypothetical protein
MWRGTGRLATASDRGPYTPAFAGGQETVTYALREKTLGPVSRLVNMTQTTYDETGTPTVEIDWDDVLLLKQEKLTRGWDIPDFSKRVARGELLPHTEFYQYERDDLQHAGTSVRYDSNGVLRRARVPALRAPGEVSWALQEPNLSVYGDFAEFNYLTQQAAANIYTKGHDTLTFLAELGKLSNLVQGLGQRIHKLTQRKNPADWAKIWLEGRYGWRTLIYDLDDLHGAVEEFDRARHRYSEKAGFTTRERDISNLNVSRQYNVTHRTTTRQTVVGRRGSVTADIYPPRFRTNIVTTAWELLPWSFVVDWVYSVGSSLEAMSFQLLSSDYVASLGYKVTESKLIDEKDVEWVGAWNGKFHYSSTSSVSVAERKPASVNLSPKWRLSLDGYKVVDLIALVKGKIPR